MYSGRRFDVRPDIKIRASFDSAPSVQFSHQLPEDLCLQLWHWGRQPLLRQRGFPLNPLWSHGCISWRRIIVGSGKSEWVKTKTRIALAPHRTTLRQPPPKQPPEAYGSSNG